jgi:hypothetical protein
MDDNTAQFVFDLNLSRFVDKLRLEHDPDMRETVKRLLIEEENKFGRKRELLIWLERHIGEGRCRIASQNALITKLRANGDDLGLAETVLSNLVETQSLFEQYRYERSRSL